MTYYGYLHLKFPKLIIYGDYHFFFSVECKNSFERFEINNKVASSVPQLHSLTKDVTLLLMGCKLYLALQRLCIES